MATVKLQPLDGEVIHEPTAMTNILKEFTDVMLLKLGVKPPTRPPYHMAPPELVELKKQLDELLLSSIVLKYHSEL